MNKQGKRFHEKRIKVSKEILESLIEPLRKNWKLKELANKLGVCYYTLAHDWLIKGNTIPLSIFKKLLRLNDKNLKEFKDKVQFLDSFWGQKKGGSKNRPYKLPDKNTKEFAEFYGIMLGDGCIYSNLSGLCIVGDKILDKNYHRDYIVPLINELFGIMPRLCYSKIVRAVRITLYSKPICEYLFKLDFPKGIKLLSSPKIPSFIAKNDELSAFCIRGLFDTDGSLSPHPHSKIMVHFSIISDSLRNSVFNSLKKLGVSAGVYNKGIVIYTKQKVAKFMDIIGTSNYKNIIKYQQFLKTGRVPRTKEVEIFIRDESSKNIMGP